MQNKKQNLPKLSLSKAGKKQPQRLKDSKKSYYISPSGRRTGSDSGAIN